MNKYFTIFILFVVLLSGCKASPAAPPDGVYSIDVSSSTSMFRITDCKLTVENEIMTAVITLSGSGFGELYLGTGAEAENAPESEYIPYTETPDGKHRYEFTVPALDKGFELTGRSIRKQTWYDHTVTFISETIKPYEELSDTIPDGAYTVNVTLSGGSGKASVESPAKVTVADTVLTATIVWSSKNYTYMIVDGEKYLPINAQGENSTFEIPITLDADIPITAQTVAMSEPRDIDYVLRFERASLTLALSFAQNFSVSYATDTPVITFQGGVVFEIKNRPQRIYLAATSAMCSFDALDALSAIAFSGTAADGWYIENARAAMEEGRVIYAGRYSAPDYEMLLTSGCDLAIESNMISHAPEVREKLEALDIPVIIDMSSYETHPLGRAEWIKLYGALLGKERLAAEIFNEQAQALDAVTGKEKTGKTAAFFYINSMGLPVVRKSGDYVAKMIGLAGGTYIFDDIGDPNTATGTVTIEMETFYSAARDADVIIYNSAIGEELETLDGLLRKNNLLKDFKAVQSGDVWCVTKNFYQETTGAGFMISDMRLVFENGDEEGLRYIRKLR